MQGACRVETGAAESNGQEHYGSGHQGDVHDNLRLQTPEACETIRVEVSRKQHQLEEQDGGGPDRRRPAEKWQNHLRDHRLEAEEQECTEQQRRLEENSQLVREHT